MAVAVLLRMDIWCVIRQLVLLLIKMNVSERSSVIIRSIFEHVNGSDFDKCPKLSNEKVF